MERGATVKGVLATSTDGFHDPGGRSEVTHVAPLVTGDYLIGCQFDEPLDADDMRHFLPDCAGKRFRRSLSRFGLTGHDRRRIGRRLLTDAAHLAFLIPAVLFGVPAGHCRSPARERRAAARQSMRPPRRGRSGRDGQYLIRRDGGEDRDPCRPGPRRPCPTSTQRTASSAIKLTRPTPTPALRLARWCECERPAAPGQRPRPRRRPDLAPGRAIVQANISAISTQGRSPRATAGPAGQAARRRSWPPPKPPSRLNAGPRRSSCSPPRCSRLLMNACSSCHAGEYAGKFPARNGFTVKP